MKKERLSDDINSGSAVVLWPMEKGVRGKEEETWGAKGRQGKGEQSQEEEEKGRFSVVLAKKVR